MFNAYNNSYRSVSAYQRINVETSMHTIDQHQLVSLLLEGAIGSIATARGALGRGDIVAKCNAIAKAIRIIDEGLSTALDKEDGGELAQNLGAIYGYGVNRLIQANAQNSDGMMLEVMRLLEPIAQGWNEMKKNAMTSAGPAYEISHLASVGV